MKVLLISDMAHTGFGRVGRELAMGLLARDHDVRIIGINFRGVTGEFEGITKRLLGTIQERVKAAGETLSEDPLLDRIIPAGEYGDGMGNNLTAPAIRGQLFPNNWKPEGVIIVADPRALAIRLERDERSVIEAKHKGIAVLNYVPIEGTNLPQSMMPIYNHVTPVAMSAFGQGELQKLLGRDVPLALHGISPEFRPVTPTDPGTYDGKFIQTRDAAKQALGLDGRTVILRADRYIFRKNYPAFFRIMRPVFAQHPEVIAVVHTPLGDDVGYGDIRESISREPGVIWRGGLEWEHPQIRLTRAHDSFRGVSDADLRVLYSAADLYVSPTMAEGFGLCLAESLACGTPVVANDYSAVGEVVGPGGILTAPAGLLTNGYAHEWSLADEPAMSAAVERLVSKPALRRQLGAEGRRHVARFTWDAAVDVFDELLAKPAAVAA